MTTLQEAVKAVLDGDATLGALATGGIHDQDSVGQNGLEIKDLIVSGNPTIQPAVYVKWSTQVKMPEYARALRAEHVFFEVYFYQHAGYDVIHDMRVRVRQLLDYQTVTIDEPSGYENMDILWAGDLLGMYDESLGNAAMERSRYQAVIVN